MSHHGHDHAHDAGDHHDVGIAKYVYVFIALCVLTTMSFFTYSSYWPFHEQPNISRSFMMAVSCTKALLVILFFMHVKYEANWKYVLTIPAAFMSLFLLLALVPDIGMRGRRLSEERKLYMAEPRPDAHRGPAATTSRTTTIKRKVLPRAKATRTRLPRAREDNFAVEADSGICRGRRPAEVLL